MPSMVSSDWQDGMDRGPINQELPGGGLRTLVVTFYAPSFPQSGAWAHHTAEQHTATQPGAWAHHTAKQNTATQPGAWAHRHSPGWHHHATPAWRPTLVHECKCAPDHHFTRATCLSSPPLTTQHLPEDDQLSGVHQLTIASDHQHTIASEHWSKDA